MVDYDEGEWIPSPVLVQFYGSGETGVIESEFISLGKLLDRYEQFGEEGFTDIQKAYTGDIKDLSHKGQKYFESNKKRLIEAFEKENICKKLKSPEFSTAEKLLPFLNIIIISTLGIPDAIAITIAEIILIYGIEKLLNCD